MTESALHQLKNLTTVVADSSDLEAIEKFRPLDATTNPSLITAAAEQPESKELIEDAYTQAKQENYQGDELIERTIDILTVKFGVEILKLIDGRVSTEVDASLSYDTEATIAKARELSKLYQGYGIEQSRILIKIASTWEGIQAAKVLEAEGIPCNLTLLFGLHQAQACADAKVTLISPFVGRIYDWFKKQTGIEYDQTNDPGIASVRTIFNYYKKFNIPTQVMGASFRNIGQILGLTGCDLLTISPDLLKQLQSLNQPLKPALSAADAQSQDISQIRLNESTFRLSLNNDAMANEKLAEGIRLFCADTQKLVQLIEQV